MKRKLLKGNVKRQGCEHAGYTHGGVLDGEKREGYAEDRSEEGGEREQFYGRRVGPQGLDGAAHPLLQDGDQPQGEHGCDGMPDDIAADGGEVPDMPWREKTKPVACPRAPITPKKMPNGEGAERR